MSEAGLTDKESRFIEEYLVDLNATQAAIRAGYSEVSARSIGYENLTKPHIQEVLEARMAERSERTRVSQERVVKELAEIAFREMTNRDQVIAKELGTVPLKYGDKIKALELLGKHLGLFGKEAGAAGGGDSSPPSPAVPMTTEGLLELIDLARGISGEKKSP